MQHCVTPTTPRDLASLPSDSPPPGCRRRSPQVKGMHTIIRDRDTGKNDFVFYADR